MRRIIASFLAALSVATIPALALADAPTTHGDCAKKCDCAANAKSSATSAPQEPSDWVKSIWNSP